MLFWCCFFCSGIEKPSPVSNCTVFNETSESVELSCDEGHDGGLAQHFVLEVLQSDSAEMRYNASSNSPAFHLGNLTPIGTGFRVLVYSVNGKGRSEPFRIDDLVIRQSEKYAGWVSWLFDIILLSSCGINYTCVRKNTINLSSTRHNNSTIA